MDINLPLFLSTCIDGVVMGLIYSLVGIGLSLVFSLMGILNFAHISFMVICIYLCVSIHEIIGNTLISLAGGVIIYILFGFLVYTFFIIPIFKFGLDAAMMNTFALSYFIEVLILYIFGPFYKKPIMILPNIEIKLFGILTYSSYRLSVAFISIIILLFLFYFIKKSMFGIALRAVTQDLTASFLVGINPKKITMYGFLISILITGIAGILVSPLYIVSPTAYDRFLPISFAVAIVGGLGNIEGALVAGLMIGLIESLGSVYISSVYKDVIIFVILMLTLLVRPKGIFGRR
ncbi:MAG: branched-chain amino acid ABC transporter permease [Saccharolobus sp.]|uniref:branched-chain amino acid ABC transporter permease n=1 Tax=Saccharolobus sp. TaxID=2100761 RepID=UPI003173892C